MPVFNRLFNWCEVCDKETSHIKEDNILSCEECNNTEEITNGR